jgi:transcriptional regulatory protein LEU3
MCLPGQHVTNVREFIIFAQDGTHKYMSRIASYLRLVVLAVGFQDTAKTQTGLCRDSAVVLKSVNAAREVIQIMVERLYPTGNLRYALEANFLYVSFAAAFLINVSQIV